MHVWWLLGGLSQDRIVWVPFWCFGVQQGALRGVFRRVVGWDAPKHGPLRQVGFLHVRM
jgi:hypothetical protein